MSAVTLRHPEFILPRIIERDRFQVKNESDKGGHAPFIRQALYRARFGRSREAGKSMNSSRWNSAGY